MPKPRKQSKECRKLLNQLKKLGVIPKSWKEIPAFLCPQNA